MFILNLFFCLIGFLIYQKNYINEFFSKLYNFEKTNIIHKKTKLINIFYENISPPKYYSRFSLVLSTVVPDSVQKEGCG